MVQPLAAAIKQRPSSLVKLKSALRSMARPSRRPFPSDFFSPLPRQSKGKEKAVECNQCWLPSSDPTFNSCISRHSPWCPIRNRLSMLDQVIPRRSQPFSHPSQRSTRRLSSSAARILSSQTRLLDWPQNVHPTHDSGEPADKLRFLLTARDPFDPEHAWCLYISSVQADTNSSTLTPREQLQFIQRLIDALALCGDSSPDLPSLHTWGTRLEPVLRDLESHLDDSLVAFKCFNAWVHAWLGDVEQASQLARQIRGTCLNLADRCTLLCVYRDILVLLHYQQSAACALDLLIREWEFLGTFCQTRTIALPQVASFRETIQRLLADIPDGSGLLSSRSRMAQDDRLHLGELLLEAYCAKKLLHQAHGVALEMGRQQLPLKFHLQAKLTRLLAQQDLFVLAREIFTSMEPSIDPLLYYSTGLHLYARHGDVDRAELFFSKHNDNNWSIPVARCMLMHAYAVAGKVDMVVELFHNFFPSTSEGDFVAERPGIMHYTTVILAHAELADLDGINFWLKEMLGAGCRPDGHVYSIILQSFARHGDVDSVAAIMDQMRTAGLKPDRVHYTSVISLLARRKDAVAAEAFYTQALREGITPDRKMITSLMNAHVEAGSWAGVVRVFDYLRQPSHFRRDLSIEAYNTLFKAYVLLGTPLRVVLAVFRKLVRVGVRPDGYTYALVIQSACDAGKMGVAEELFAEMEDRVEPLGPPYHFDAYVLTIIMAGYLRRRSMSQAKACYDNMQRRGIKPSSVTYKQVLQAYANDRTKASLKIAESFLSQIMDADADDPSWTGSESRSSALGNVYSPLMLAYARKATPEEVVRLFGGMLEAGGRPSLGSLTIFLDVHRRTNNIEVVRQVWPQIWELALQLSCANELFKKAGSASASVPRRRSNLLCTPLSIYIDALSAAGEHRAVLDAWTRAKAEGFSFDAHNWNHLAVVLVRAGELDRAFEVLERVLIPYSRKGLIVRDPCPESPLIFDAISPDVELPASDAPMHRRARREKAVKATTKMVGSRLEMPEDSTDFAHPLHILHQTTPGLSVWRPHAVTLYVLSKVLGHLQRGRLVQPICAVDAPPATGESQADSRSQVELAGATLQRIYRDYPEAVRAVLLYERGQSRRDAARRSPRK